MQVPDHLRNLAETDARVKEKMKSRRETLKKSFKRNLGMEQQTIENIHEAERVLDRQNGNPSGRLAGILRKHEFFRQWMENESSVGIIKVALNPGSCGDNTLGVLVSRMIPTMKAYTTASHMVHFHCPPDCTVYIPGKDCLLRKLLTDIASYSDHVPSPPSDDTGMHYLRSELLQELDTILCSVNDDSITVVIHGLDEYAKHNEDEAVKVMQLLVDLQKRPRSKLSTGLSNKMRIMLTAPIPTSLLDIEEIREAPTITLK